VRQLVDSRVEALVIAGESGTGRRSLARAFHQGHVGGGEFTVLDCRGDSRDEVARRIFGNVPPENAGESKGNSALPCVQHGTMVFHELDHLGVDFRWEVLHRLARRMQSSRLQPQQRLPHRIVVTLRIGEYDSTLAGGAPLHACDCLGVPLIMLSPLRDRREDILPLVDHAVCRYNLELGLSIRSISTGAASLLRHYRWPGNTRQLLDVVHRAMTYEVGNVLLAAHLPTMLHEQVLGAARSQHDQGPSVIS